MPTVKDGVAYEFTSHLPLTYTEGGYRTRLAFTAMLESDFRKKEDAMNELTVLFTLVVVRIVLPVGLLLLIGELSRSHKQSGLKGI